MRTIRFGPTGIEALGEQTPMDLYLATDIGDQEEWRAAWDELVRWRVAINTAGR